LKASKFKESLENRVRGWFPKEPKLPGKYAGNPSEKKESVLDKPISELSLDTVLSMVVGFLLILFGILGFVFNGAAVAILQDLLILAPVAALIGYFFGFWIGVVGVVVIVVLIANHTINGALLKRNFTRRRLLPYGVAAILLFSAYLASGLGVQFTYAIPIALVASGVLVFKGLKRFTVTLPAFAVVLVSMLVLGSVFAGPNVVTYTSVSRGITAVQAPSLDAVNITARTVEGDINLYFTDNSSEVCNVQYVKEYGVVRVGLSTGFNGPSAYDNEPAPVFYYSVSNSEAYVIADSFSTVMNITVNENLIGNFSLYTYYGDITVYVPQNVNTVQTLNLTSILGNVNLKISNTANVRSIAAKAGSTVTATITSTAQTQNAAVQLTGGTVNLNLQVSSVPSQITAYLTNQWVTLHAKTNGFEVINKSNTYFNAQTPNYDTSTQEKLDVNATASQSSMNIVANFNEK